MFCGDETGALILDLGSYSIKLGSAGEDTPRLDLPSLTVQSRTIPPVGDVKKSSTESPGLGKPSCGLQALLCKAKERVVTSPFGTDGTIDLSQTDKLLNLWEHGCKDVMYSDPRNHPVLLCDHPRNSSLGRSKLLELALESMQHPSVFIAPNPMLTAFSIGRSLAFVVDVGASGSIACPVVDGYLLRRSLMSNALGGELVTNHLLQRVETLVKKPIMPRCTFVKRGKQVLPRPINAIHSSYLTWRKLAVVDDIKVSVCRVWKDLDLSEKLAATYKPVEYELPDGTVMSLGYDRFASPELIINPKLDEVFVEKFCDGKQNGMVALMRNSIANTCADTRKELLQNIITVGGGSLLPGTIERLQKECSSAFPSSLKCRFLNPPKYNRKYASWTGGSILASLGSFQQMWISKQQYEECGPDRILEECLVH